MVEKANAGTSYVRRAANFFRDYRFNAVGIVAFTLIIAVLNAVEPLLLKYIFDNLGRGGAQRILIYGLAMLVGLGLVREGVGSVNNWLTWRTRLGVHHKLLDAMVDRLHRLPVSFYRSESVGAIMTRLDRSIHGVVEAASQIAFNVLPAIVYLGITLVIMVRLDWRLALIVLGFAPLPPLLAVWAAPSQTARERNLLERWMDIYSRFNEVLSGIITVRSFGREEQEKQRFMNDVTQANQAVIRGVAFDARVQAGQNFSVTLARVVAIGVGSYLAYRGQVTVGTLVAFLSYISGIFAPVQGLSAIYRTLRTASVSLESVFSILDIQDNLGDVPDAVELTRLHGVVEFENVRFSYGTKAPVILDKIDLRAAPGEMVAIVGPSGSGKSTLMALLQRLYDPDEGRILVDGHDLRNIKQRSLRDKIGVVLQDALLFNDTIRDNIAYGRPEATQHEIERVAQAAHAHEFITRLPEGYGMMVGERGSRLSPGERQRIAIARALLKDPPILIMDEATSALDAKSEALVQDALEHLMEGRTTFIIAHRLSTVIHATRVLVLMEGRIVESGTHQELIRQNGYYALLVRQQTRGLLAERLLEHLPHSNGREPERGGEHAGNARQ